MRLWVEEGIKRCACGTAIRVCVRPPPGRMLGGFGGLRTPPGVLREIDRGRMAISVAPERPSFGKRAIVYDVTHLTTRLQGVTTTGIDWVDRAYARHWAQSERLACGLHYGLLSPHSVSPPLLAELSKRHDSKFMQTDASASDSAWRQARKWLTGRSDHHISSTPIKALRESFVEGAELLAMKSRLRLAHDRNLQVPEGAIYLNVAQHGLEYPALFRWLDSRPDVVPVFLAHDLLPVDFPEYFRPGYKPLFRRRFELIAQRARAIITTCGCTADRLREEFRAYGCPCPPIHAQPLPSPLEVAGDLALHDFELEKAPYFVIVGTIEPRKNHLLLLNIWRDLSAKGGETPKLICVGGRGWGGAQIIDSFERSKVLAPHVRRVSGLSSEALRRLVANARALLAPNFAEGYGIPIVEALSVGAPVACSDIPVFHEVAQECATFLSPLDGAGWRSAIRALAVNGSVAGDGARRLARNFKAPNWTQYFANVEAFLDSL
jgi:glycosyltransferase involved in cell wall biosynthesis